MANIAILLRQCIILDIRCPHFRESSVISKVFFAAKKGWIRPFRFVVKLRKTLMQEVRSQICKWLSFHDLVTHERL